MHATYVMSFLVSPAKNEAVQPPIQGAVIPQQGQQLWRMLGDLFAKADDECRTGIAFQHNDAGEQQNACRDAIVRYLRTRSLGNGLVLAERLQAVTTKKSGLGLFFLIYGTERGERKLVISRFPAEQGLLAEEGAAGLSIQFVEKVFMKSAHAYKAAVYRGRSLDGDFWLGKAIDKQISDGAAEITRYWVHDFLLSDLQTPGALGTRRFAHALKSAAKVAATLEVQDELASLSKLSSRLRGIMSVSGILRRFEVSDHSAELIRTAIGKQRLLDEEFQFDRDEYSSHLAYRSVELNSGGVMTAAADRFDEIFQRQQLGGAEQRFRFTAEGRVVQQRLRKAKG